ncbi:cytochrome o ubiquinol oxidase subunit IV [Falsirhodobacter algicola]|uniref:Cytochrome o ubiquinol oxidase subunit IV n=1 Tax=Falsirhodobacter algicola TaxID=2692330 RepID=A0A8J8MU25_9RHOB|nr:cytochrome o ubiquinol oxidase subunit IV [Falsirhodobacter algicola]QUS36454.1 cytochrome o ubiquinol oxidase subunit IV [Falsirhodobacter algicola]
MSVKKERRSYLIGYVLALILTLPVLGLTASGALPRGTLLWVAGVAAVVQIAVHFRFFLHIRLKGQTREDLHLILFTTLILALMGGGTIWIMADLAARM